MSNQQEWTTFTATGKERVEDLPGFGLEAYLHPEDHGRTPGRWCQIAGHHTFTPGSQYRYHRYTDDETKPKGEPVNMCSTTHDVVSAAGALGLARDAIMNRGRTYDASGQERSAGRVAIAFNAITGHMISAAEVYLLMQLVKDARQWSCESFHQDSAIDSVAFAALKTEALSKE